MAVLYITEAKRFGHDDRGVAVPALQMPPVAEQTVAIGVGSVNSAPFNDKTRAVELHCDAVCHIAWSTSAQVKAGTQVAAVTSKKRLPADSTQFFTVEPGGSVAVIQGV